MFTGIFISILFGLIPAAMVVIIIVLIVKRIRDKEREDFEKRKW